LAQLLKLNHPTEEVMKQKYRSSWFAALLGGAAIIALAGTAKADLVINTFDNFTSDALYASWSSGTIVSGATSYSVTATGYGSNYKYNPIAEDGTGNTTVQLTVTLSAADPANADGRLGPIITLVDGDGTEYNYAWYGQTTGHHVLTMPINSPTWMTGPNNGLDLSTLTHLHIQLDPSSYAGQYTVVWEDARLIGTTPPQITSESYDPATHQFTLTWTSSANGTYAVQYSSSVSGPFTDLQTGIAGAGATTTFSVTVPNGDAGFLRIRPQ
jgi:hypothetical protein